jgi:hypothetical protein
MGRSLITTLSILIGYQCLISYKLIKPGLGLNQWEQNVIKFQNYAYQDHSETEIVLVGSSLTALLNPADISNKTLNLGMSAGSSQTGLEVVSKKSLKPKIVLIEINTWTILIELDAEMVESIYNPILFNLRLFLPMFQKQYQPDFQVIKVVNLASAAIGNLNPSPQPRSQPQNVLQAQQLREQLILKAQKEFSAPITTTEKYLVIRQVAHLKSRIQSLEKQGTRVFLYQLPGEARLEATSKEKQAQILFKQLLPSDRYSWIPKPPPRAWKTSDGMHLIPADSTAFAQYLRTSLAPYLR